MPNRRTRRARQPVFPMPLVDDNLLERVGNGDLEGVTFGELRSMAWEIMIRRQHRK